MLLLKQRLIVLSLILLPVFSFGQGNALNFDGVDDQITCGDIDLTSFTLEAWVKTTIAGNYTILSKGDGNGAALGENYMFQIQNGKVALHMDQGGVALWHLSTGSIPNNTWCHVAVTYDNSTRINTFYINGVFNGSVVRANADPFQDNTQTFIGRQGTGCNCNFFNGAIDEVRIWNQVLSCEDINSWKNCQLIGNESGLVSYYQFNQGIAGGANNAVTTLDDAVGPGNHNGTLNYPSFALNGATSNWVTSGASVSGTCGAATTREITVTGNSNMVFDGDLAATASGVNHTDYALILPGQTVTRTYTIQNTGTGNLNIDDIFISGTDAAMFTQSNITLPLLIPAGNSGTFDVTFMPSSTGVKTAQVNIISNDCDESVFDFGIKGEGGFPGAAINFNGTNKVNISYATDLNLSAGDFTIEFWAKPSSVGGAHHWVVSKDDGNGDLDFLVGLTSNSKWTCYARNLGISLFGTSVAVVGNYYHIACVLRGNTAYLYVNGVLEASTSSIGTPGSNTSGIVLGARTAAATTEYFEGDIDEVRFWNRGLCLDEITNNKNCEIPTTAPGLVVNYHCNDGVAAGTNYGLNTLDDATGNSHTGMFYLFSYVGPSANWVMPGGVTTGSSCTTFSFPEIAIKGNGNVIASDASNSPGGFDNTDFGSVTVASALNKSFVIENSGTAQLNLTINTTYVKITGSSDFTLFTDANASVNASGNTPFTIRFSPSSVGVKNATITVLSNDCDEPSYVFNIKGIGGSAPVATGLNFDGVNDYVETNYTPTLDELGQFSIECWVKANAAPIVGGSQYNGPLFAVPMGIIWDHNDPTFAGGAHVKDGSGNYYNASFGTLLGNTWYHLAATYDGTTLKSYKNGVLQTQVTTGGGITYYASTLKVGKHPYGVINNDNYFSGNIDEVRVWSRTLTPTEINANKSCGISGAQECLQYYYNFNTGFIGADNSSITTVTDLSGRGRTGMLTNFTLNGATSNFNGGAPVSGTCSGTVFPPEIDIKGNNISIVDGAVSPSFGDSTDFGNVDILSSGNVNTFVINNYGSGSTLTLSGTPKVGITGSSDFTLDTDAAASSLGSFGSTPFKIAFKPSSPGAKTATVSIKNSDCDERDYTFTISGTGALPGAALDFDGGDDHISLANSTDYNFDLADSFTIEFWFKTNSSGQEAIFSTITNSPMNNGYEVYLSGGKLAFMMSSDITTNNYLNVLSTDFVNDGVWHHAAVIYKGISDVNSLEMYIDEVLQTLIPTRNTLTGLMLSTNTAYVGVRGNSGQNYFYTGELDELRIWKRVVCSPELNSFNNCERTGTLTGLVGYYDFNQGLSLCDNSAITTLTDRQGGNNSGTLNGFTLNGATSNWTDQGGVVSGAVCGVLIEPEIVVTGNTINIVNADISPSTSDNSNFGNVQTGSPKTLNFLIRNTGTTALNFLTNPKILIYGGPDFIVVNQPSGPIAVGGSFSFSIRFDPVSAGAQTATVYISTNDCDESDFHYTIAGFGLPPAEINVKQNITNIPDAGSFNFGNRVVNSPQTPKTFTIENLSSGGNLSLSGTPKVKISGTNATNFTVSIAALPDTITTLSSANFTVTFVPSSAGAKTAQLSIANNDPDENPYNITLSGNGVVAGDVDSSGSISTGEIAGDTSGNGIIEFPSEITGDVNGGGSIGVGEIAGDADGDGQINNGEIAGNTNGTGGIDGTELSGDVDGNGVINGTEFTGDVNGNGILDPGEFIGDIDGIGGIVAPEVLGDIDGDGIVDPLPSYVLVGQGTIVTNYLSTYTIQPALPVYYTYAWFYSDESLYMLKDTTRRFMDVVANNQTNDGTLYCIIYRFGVPYDTMDFNVHINKSYLNIAELAELSAECAAVANPANNCTESFIDYFKLKDINYDGNGCVQGGFQDLTASGYTTNLEMGFTYTMELKPNKLLFFPNPQDPTRNDTTTVFYAVWIDYNNDGDFEDFAEYVKNGDSKSVSKKLINITIANNELYVGSRRLRVGMKTGSGFTSTDACGINAIGTSGELEDYLITLVPMGALQAPNFLSPNDDGDNDLFSIKGIDMEKTRVLIVMNKTGAVVYQEENYGNKELWSGKGSNGELLPKGTYYYIFKNGTDELKSFLEIDY